MKIPQLDLLQTIRQKLNAVEICNLKQAYILCKIIPSYCPFEQDIKIFGHLIVRIPPLCKLNPLYQQLIELRFRALSYLTQYQIHLTK